MVVVVSWGYGSGVVVISWLGWGLDRFDSGVRV